MFSKTLQSIPYQKKVLLFFCALISLFCIIYHNILNAGFVSWDDGEVLLNNKDVHRFNVRAFFTEYYVGNYAPITMVSFAVDWFLFHGNSTWHHAVNLVLHFINAYLVFCITKHLFKNTSIAVACTTIFAFHPLQIETIAWISAKNNLLYSLFFLLALWFYLQYKVSSLTKHLIFTFSFFILACLSKPSAICFPLCLLVFDIYFDKTLSLKKQLYQIPFGVVTIIVGIVTFFSRTEAKFINTEYTFTFYEKLGYAGFAMANYIYKFFIPINLSVIYPYPQNKWLSIGIGYLVLFLLGFIIYKFYTLKKDKALFGILFFVINLLLVLQFIPFGETLTADRYMYLPILGLCWAFFSLIKLPDIQLKRSIPVFVLVLGLLSFTRTKVWKNSVSLYSDILKSYPNSAEALGSLGAEYMLIKNHTLALTYLNKAVAENKNYYKSYYNRGLLYAQTNRMTDAVADFTKAIQLANYHKAYVARANAYYALTDLPKAIADAEHVIVLDKNNSKAMYTLANCYDDLNQLDKALTYYTKAIELSPQESLFYLRRAIVYGKQKKYHMSLTDLNTCLLINTNYADAYYWKGVVKVNLNQNPCNEFKEALRLGIKEAQNPLNMYCR